MTEACDAKRSPKAALALDSAPVSAYTTISIAGAGGRPRSSYALSAHPDRRSERMP